MDAIDIPVLTKKVKVTATEPAPSASALNMAQLVAEVKLSVLSELSEQWTAQIAEQVSAQVKQRVAAQVEAEQQTFSDYAKLVQQSLVNETQAQIGDGIQAIEQAFREAMNHVGKQQLQTVQETFEQLSQTQQDLMTQKVQSLTDELLSTLTVHVRQLQTQSKQTLSTEHEMLESNLTQEYRQSLESAFTEFAALQTAEFKQKFTADLPAIENALQEKVNALVLAKMAEIEQDIQTRLKSRIIEVLQGIKFVMPSV